MKSLLITILGLCLAFFCSCDSPASAAVDSPSPAITSVSNDLVDQVCQAAVQDVAGDFVLQLYNFHLMVESPDVPLGEDCYDCHFQYAALYRDDYDDYYQAPVRTMLSSKYDFYNGSAAKCPAIHESEGLRVKLRSEAPNGSRLW